MLFNVPLSATALLALTQVALAAPSRVEQRRVVKRVPGSAGAPPVCKTRYGPKSSAEGAIPANPQTATTACPIYANQTIEIPVYFYVPWSGSKTEVGNYYTASRLKSGIIDDLNRFYGQYKPRIKFTMKTPKYKQVTDDTWEEYFYFAPETEEEVNEMNSYLALPARGPVSSRGANQMRELWIYMLPALGGDGTLGFAYVPQSRFPFTHDGVYLDATQAMAGEDHATTTHEIGHWLRLLHTFEDGCKGTDFVSDTPPWQLDFSRRGTLLCKGSEGYDWNKIDSICGGTKGDAIKNIKNIMSYSDDRCQTDFTWGQRKRYWDGAVNYRQFKPVCALK
ncbi:hypothetical protein ACM66B_006045 [Microbotryomycetes sp. NB124-2]